MLVLRSRPVGRIVQLAENYPPGTHRHPPVNPYLRTSYIETLFSLIVSFPHHAQDAQGNLAAQTLVFESQLLLSVLESEDGDHCEHFSRMIKITSIHFMLYRNMHSVASVITKYPNMKKKTETNGLHFGFSFNIETLVVRGNILSVKCSVLQ